MTDAKKISMTEAELAALVDSRIAEHDAKAQREAEQARQLQNSIPVPVQAPRAPQASPELMAAFNSALDAANGDVDKATAQIAGMISRDATGRPTYPQFYALYMQWAGNLRGLLEIMMRRRKHAEASV